MIVVKDHEEAWTLAKLMVHDAPVKDEIASEQAGHAVYACGAIDTTVAELWDRLVITYHDGESVTIWVDDAQPRRTLPNRYAVTVNDDTGVHVAVAFGDTEADAARTLLEMRYAEEEPAEVLNTVNVTNHHAYQLNEADMKALGTLSGPKVQVLRACLEYAGVVIR